jgi:hypothetical protein
MSNLTEECALPWRLNNERRAAQVGRLHTMKV